MSYASTTVVDAINLTAETEKKASQFYLDSINKLNDRRSKRILKHLLDAELEHLDALQALKDSLQKDPTFRTNTHSPDPVDTEKDRTAIIKILNIIEDSENRAQEAYSKLANRVDDEDWKNEFLHLTAEEHLDKNILHDELYNISNNEGVYRWGD